MNGRQCCLLDTQSGNGNGRQATQANDDQAGISMVPASFVFQQNVHLGLQLFDVQLYVHDRRRLLFHDGNFLPHLP
jgi:hypothetical protein